MDYLEEEIKDIRRLFDLDEIINFQALHDVQIIREADCSCMCYIDGTEQGGWGGAFTPMGALVYGIKQYKTHQEKIKS